jgi:hypothetical protein
MPTNIYKKVRFITINHFILIHPWFLMIDYYRMFTDPMASYWRLEKHFERYMLLQKTYPLPSITDQLYFETFEEKEINKTIDILFNELVDYKTILFTGFYVYNCYLYLSNYHNDFDKKYNYINIPYIEVYSTNYVEDGLKILKFIKTLPQHILKKIFYVEYTPFFQFYGNNTIFYYNDNGKQIPILYLYENNKRSIPFKQINLIKFNINKTNIIEANIIQEKIINICSFDFNILHSLIILVKIRIDDEDEWNDIIYKYINGIILFRNHYFNKNNKNLYDETVFQSFVIECMGDCVLPERQRRLLIEVRKKIGKPYLFKYDPSLNKNISKFIFVNSSGNAINNTKYLKLTEENRHTNLFDELEKNERNQQNEENNEE